MKIQLDAARAVRGITRPARSRPVRAFAAATAALAVFVLSACKQGENPNAYAPPPPPEVIVANPVQRDVVKYLTYTGIVAASETVELRARVQGFLEKVHFQPGQRVKAGELLFEIDPRQYKAEVDQSAAIVQATKATLVGAENDARLARELADQRAGPEIDALIKAARRDTVVAEVARAEAQLANAMLNLEFCRVLAPIDGRIGKNLVDPGNLVGRGEPTLLAEIVQATPAFVYIDLSESDVLAFRREGRDAANGQERGNSHPCELALADRPEFEHKGVVDYSDPKLNPDTGTLRIRTRYENTDEVLLPGFFSRVRFPMQTRQAILVPEAALLQDQQGRYALVVNEKDEVEARRVEIGVLEGSMRVVEKGLQTADRVIVSGVLKARPGAKVSPKSQPENAAGGR